MPSANAHAFENGKYAGHNTIVVFWMREQDKTPFEAIRKVIREDIQGWGLLSKTHVKFHVN